MKTTLIKTIAIVLVAFITNFTSVFGQNIIVNAVAYSKIVKKNNKWVKVEESLISGVQIETNVSGGNIAIHFPDGSEVFHIKSMGITRGACNVEILKFVVNNGTITMEPKSRGLMDVTLRLGNDTKVVFTCSNTQASRN